MAGGDGVLTGSSRASHADIGVDEGLAACWNDSGFGGIDVIASCEGTAACGQSSLVGEFLDQKRDGHCGSRVLVGDLDAFSWR